METDNRPIGLLDSGMGGISVLRELVRLMPEEDYLFFGDSKNAPYGTKRESEVLSLTEHAVDFLLGKGAKAIVVACNTATSVAIGQIRKKYPTIPVIGIEPALKPAVLAKEHSTVLVMATPMTLAKEKFSNLMHLYESDARILKLPCPKLVELIEAGHLEGPELDTYLAEQFAGYKEEHLDAVVLGCTHFPLVRDAIKRALPPGTAIYDGGEGTARETKRRLEQAGLCCERKGKGTVKFFNSSENLAVIHLCQKLLGRDEGGSDPLAYEQSRKIQDGESQPCEGR